MTAAPEPRPALLGLSTAALSALAVELGEPAFRGRQLADWLYRQGVSEVGAMTNLPGALRQRLAAGWSIGRAPIAAAQESRDGTRKLLLELADGARIETVGLPYADRASVCLSSQTGCAVGCVFCATGYLGAGRNLRAGELVDQVLTVQEQLQRRVTHVVYMGMGEPLLNLDEVVQSVHLLHEEVGVAQRNMTISTVGLPAQIDRLAAADLSVTLAVSLHAAEDGLRRSLIPTTAQRWTVDEVVAAARRYATVTGRRLTFEIVLLAGVNDQPTHAAAVARVLRRGEHVNLIPYNAVGEARFRRPAGEAIRAFRAVLEAAGLAVTQRQTRGRDIAGACGQLRARTDEVGG